MKETTPTLTINLYINCPECDNFFCLLDDTDLNDEGYILDMALPEGPWVDEHEKFECELICPECKNNFKAKGVNW